MIVGYTTSRLIELKKYTVTNDFTQQYFGNGSINHDGVDYANSVAGVYVTYYIGGLKYIDSIGGDIPDSTLVSYEPKGMTDADFISTRMIKNPNKEKIISNPKIDDDVFIVRQELSVFDKNYRLQYIRNLTELDTYAAGGFFNIVNNT